MPTNEKLVEAEKTFENTGITIKASARVLGSVIRTETDSKKFLEFQQNVQVKILKKLMKIANTFMPQNVYAGYTIRFQEKISFLTRTTPNNMENLETCAKIIKEQLIPTLVGKDTFNPQFREISTLPLKMDGSNIKLPSDHESFLEWSKETSLVLESQDPVTALTEQEKFCRKHKKLKTDGTNRKKTNLLNSLTETDKYAFDLAFKKASLNG